MSQGAEPPGRFPGTYLLRFDLRETLHLDIGRLGEVQLFPGTLYYAGSAFGPGGVAARVNRHVTGCGKPHWHVDRLRAAVPVSEVWYSHASQRLEHAWAGRLLAMSGAQPAFPGFGSSDCRCPAHLVHFVRAASRRQLAAEFGDDDAVRWVPGL